MRETDDAQYKRTPGLFLAMVGPARRRILPQLLPVEDCTNVIQKVLGLTRSGFFCHTKILAEAGLVQCRTARQRACCSPDRDGAQQLMGLLDQFARYRGDWLSDARMINKS